MAMIRPAYLVVLCLALAALSPAQACGILRVTHRFVPTGQLTIGYQRVEVEIDNQLAITRVHQQFRNPTPDTLEGEYSFELPAEASVSGFAIWDGATRVPGVIQRREVARAGYEAARARGDTAGLVEQTAANVFAAHVTPIRPGEDKKIELEYREMLGFDSGLVRYRFPLVRADGTKASLAELVITATLTDATEIESAWSPAAGVAVHHHDAHRVSVSFESSKDIPDRDLEIFFKLKTPKEGLRYRAHRDDDGPGTLLLAVCPGDQGLPRRAKDVVFVVDTSGSMEGKKIVQARRALRYCLSALDPEDRFNIVRFSTDQESFAAKLVPAVGADLDRARTYADALAPGGGTNIEAAMSAALASFGGPATGAAAVRYVVLVTDGEPTVGIVDPQQILERVRAANTGGARIFTFGVDEAAGSGFLARMAGEHRGESIAVRAEDDLDARLPVFFGKLTQPLFEDVKLAFEGARVVSVHPRDLPHFYLGRQLVVLARYPEPGQASATVTARMDGKPVSWSLKMDLPARAAGAPGLPRLWAQREVETLTSGRDPAGLPAEVREEIVRLSTVHTFVTPFTSFLATPERTAATNESTVRPVDLNRGVGSIQDEKGEVARDKDSLAEPPAPAASPAPSFSADDVAKYAQMGKPQARRENADMFSKMLGEKAPVAKKEDSLDLEGSAASEAQSAPGGAAGAGALPAAQPVPPAPAASPAEGLADSAADRDAGKTKGRALQAKPREEAPERSRENAGLVNLTKSYVDKLTRMTPDEREKLKSSIQKFNDSKAPLSIADKRQLTGRHTSPTKDDDFNNRLQMARSWMNDLAAAGKPVQAYQDRPKLLQTLYYSNKVMASRKLDHLLAELQGIEDGAPVLAPEPPAAPPVKPPEKPQMALAKAKPAPAPVVNGMDAQWRSLRAEVASLRAAVRTLKARLANLDAAHGNDAQSLRPVVEAISVEPPLVLGGQAAHVSIAVRYPAGARPAISWRAKEGNLVAAHDGAALWIAPDVPGAYTLTVSLVTPAGQRYDEEVDVEVYQPGLITYSPAHLDERLFLLNHALDELRREHAELTAWLARIRTAHAPSAALLARLSTPPPQVMTEAVEGHPAVLTEARSPDESWRIVTAEWKASDFSWLLSQVEERPVDAKSALPAR